MALICEDLASYGVVLIPPSSQQYFDLLADIERRLQNQPKGLPPLEDGALSRIAEHDTRGAAILQNKAKVAIASVGFVWWFRGNAGRILPHRFLPGTNPSVLLPFGLNHLKLETYWNTVFPNSKRLITAGGHWYGDNTDVRAPDEDELWHGGFFSMSGGSASDSEEPVKLTLDGVFFADGGFAGPNTLGVLEHTRFAAEAFLACAALARKSPSDFFTQVQQLTGQTDSVTRPPPPPPPPLEPGPKDEDSIRSYERRMVGRTVLSMRSSMGDEKAVANIAAWSDAPAPKLHKL